MYYGEILKAEFFPSFMQGWSGYLHVSETNNGYMRFLQTRSWYKLLIKKVFTYENIFKSRSLGPAFNPDNRACSLLTDCVAVDTGVILQNIN